MADYDVLAAHYDAATGDSASETAFIDRIIKQECGGRAVTLLEVACGTGSITGGLADRYQVSGLDISAAMLAVARKKLPGGTPLHLADMSSFELGTTFDAIACVYHGINHLLSFAQWESFFDCAYRHLNPGGVLIFDIMTGPSLERMAKTRQTVQQFGDNYLLTKVRASGEMLFDWETEVYELQPSGQYLLLKEIMTTAWFPDDKIRDALRKRFSDVTIIDSDGSVADDDSENRTWFVCTKSGS
ncbi:MAG: class I SAM-dependent methyltransferase [Streptosporangiaceae bacterium]